MVKTTLWVLGVVFILIGVWGFFTEEILGIFAVDTMHNLVHIISGVLALIFAGKPEAGRLYARILGIIYVLVAILGFFGDSILGLFVVNMADTWLHLVIALVLLYVGFTAKDEGSTASPSPSMGGSQPM